MKRLIFTLGFILAIFSLKAQMNNYQFFFTVLDSISHQYINGAQIELDYNNGVDSGSLSGFADTNGSVHLALTNLNNPLSLVNVSVSAEGYENFYQNVQVDSNIVTAVFYLNPTDTAMTGMFNFMWMQNSTNPLTVTFYPFIDSIFGQQPTMFNFGDGSPEATLSGDSIVHTYGSEGIYGVGMYLEDESQYFFDTIHVFGLYPDSVDCFADFDYFPTDIMELNWHNFQFFNNSYGSDLTYSWSFGDGATSSEENPQHTYSTGGYWVTLSINNGTCSDALTLPIWAGDVNDLWYPDSCQALFYTIYDTANVVHFIDMSFTPNQIVERHWNFGDSTEAFSVASPIHQYADTGLYTVTYSIVDINGHQSSYSQDVYVSNVQDSCLLFFPDSIGDTKALSVKFHNLSKDESDWVWNFGDSKATYKGSKVYIIHTYENPGQYHVTAHNDKGEAYAEDIKVDSNGKVTLLKGYGIKVKSTSGLNSVKASTVTPYPNPATEVLNIRIANNNSNLTIYTANGQKILDKNYNAGIAKINVSYLPAGVYTVRISNKGKVYTGKFVK